MKPENYDYGQFNFLNEHIFVIIHTVYELQTFKNGPVLACHDKGLYYYRSYLKNYQSLKQTCPSRWQNYLAPWPKSTHLPTALICTLAAVNTFISFHIDDDDKAAKQQITRLLSNLRPTTREWVHLVTRGNFRSSDKDDGHTIRSVITENPMLHANFTALCFIETELLPIEVLHCGNRDFWPFLLLLLWPWPHNLHI